MNYAAILIMARNPRDLASRVNQIIEKQISNTNLAEKKCKYQGFPDRQGGAVLIASTFYFQQELLERPVCLLGDSWVRGLRLVIGMIRGCDSAVVSSMLLLAAMLAPCFAGSPESADTPASSVLHPFITIEFFTDTACNECDLVRLEVLPLIEARYGGLFKLVEAGMNDDSAVLRMAEAADRLGIADNKRIFLLLNGQYAFCDPAVMLNEVSVTIDKLLQNGIASLQ